MTRNVVSLALSALAASGATCAVAQVQPYVPQVAEMAGAMHATAKVCQDYTDEQLRDLKQQQKTHAVASGMAAQQFETIFQAGYDKARARLGRATPAERDQACKQARAIAGMNGAGR